MAASRGGRGIERRGGGGGGPRRRPDKEQIDTEGSQTMHTLLHVGAPTARP